jgi:hypothetical protein
MKTFKEYINEEKYHTNSIVNQIYLNIRDDVDVKPEYFDEIFKDVQFKYDTNILLQLIIRWYIRYDRIIPQQIIKYIFNNKKLLHNIIEDIKFYYKKKMKEILRRNPEFLEYFV